MRGTYTALDQEKQRLQQHLSVVRDAGAVLQEEEKRSEGDMDGLRREHAVMADGKKRSESEQECSLAENERLRGDIAASQQECERVRLQHEQSESQRQLREELEEEFKCLEVMCTKLQDTDAESEEALKGQIAGLLNEKRRFDDFVAELLAQEAALRESLNVNNGKIAALRNLLDRETAALSERIQAVLEENTCLKARLEVLEEAVSSASVSTPLALDASVDAQSESSGTESDHIVDANVASDRL